MKNQEMTVTDNNINVLFPYQGNDTYLKQGDVLKLEKSGLPCVYNTKGQSMTFSIYFGESIKNAQYPDESWGKNRWSINDKFIK